MRRSELLAIEGSPDLRPLDTIGGIDYWEVSQQHGARPFGSRVHRVRPGGHCYGTITLRLTTASGRSSEYQRLRLGLRHKTQGWVTPYFLVETYLCWHRGHLVVHEVLVVEAEALARAAADMLEGGAAPPNGSGPWGVRRARDDGAQFFFVEPGWLEQRYGMKIWRFDARDVAVLWSAANRHAA